MDTPLLHPETHVGKRGKTYWFWWSEKGTKHRSERFKDKDVRDLKMRQKEATFASNVSPKLTSLSNEQVKEAELCRKFADDHGIPLILDALNY